MPRLSDRARRRAAARLLETTKRAEDAYVVALRGVMRAIAAEGMRLLEPDLGEVARADGTTYLSSAWDLFAVKVIAAMPQTIGPLFERMALATANANADALKVIGLPVARNAGALVAARRARDESIRLVEKAARVYAEDVRSIFENPETTSMRVEELKALLLERGRVSESRAELIARDQTLKLNAAITRERQVKAGVSRYVWSTSKDDRVREEHAALEGQTFSWDDPPPPGHPGEDYQCRCVGIPVIDELEGI